MFASDFCEKEKLYLIVFVFVLSQRQNLTVLEGGLLVQKIVAIITNASGTAYKNRTWYNFP